MDAAPVARASALLSRHAGEASRRLALARHFRPGHRMLPSAILVRAGRPARRQGQYWAPGHARIPLASRSRRSKRLAGVTVVRTRRWPTSGRSWATAHDTFVLVVGGRRSCSSGGAPAGTEPDEVRCVPGIDGSGQQERRLDGDRRGARFDAAEREKLGNPVLRVITSVPAIRPRKPPGHGSGPPQTLVALHDVTEPEPGAQGGSVGLRTVIQRSYREGCLPGWRIMSSRSRTASHSMILPSSTRK